MKIGVIVCSHTGHTQSVGEEIKTKLDAAGHEVVLEKVESEGDATPGSKNLKIVSAPDASEYEALVFAGPVMAFSLAPAMKFYMSGLGTLQGKTTALVVTKGLKFNWTGGTRAVSQMKKYCTAKGADIAGSGIIVWSSKTLKEDIDFIANEISGLF